MGGKNENYLCLKKMVLITLKSIDYNIKNIFKGEKNENNLKHSSDHIINNRLKH